MKNLLLASTLSAAVGATAAVVGPMHYQVTKPHSLHVTFPVVSNGTTTTISAGSLPIDFVVTDVVVGGSQRFKIDVLVNSVVTFTCPNAYSNDLAGTAHMTTGFLIPQGSAIDLRAYGSTNGGIDTGVTLLGYYQ